MVLWATLLVTSCGNDKPPTKLEEAVLDAAWTQVEREAVRWMDASGYRLQAAVLRGYAAWGRGDPKLAVRHFLCAAPRRMQSGDLEWAETLAEDHSGNAAAQLMTGDALVRRGDLSGALEHFDAAVRIAPDLDIARLARGTVLALLGKDVEAGFDLDPLAEASSLASEALAVRGMSRLCNGNLSEPWPISTTRSRSHQGTLWRETLAV